MGMSAEDGIDAGYPAGHLDVNVHSVVGQHDDGIGALVRLNGFHQRDHVLLANAERPVRDESLGVGIGGARKRLPDDGQPASADLPHGVGFERHARILVVQAESAELLHHLEIGVLEQAGFLDPHVLADELAVEPLHVGQQFLLVIGEFPVAGHDVHAEHVGGVHHVPAPRPERRARTLPQVSAVHGQGVLGTAGLLPQHVEQGLQVGESPHAAELPGAPLEIEVGVGICLDGILADAGTLKQRPPHQVGQPPLGRANTQVHVGLTEIDRQKLRMNVCHVQDPRIALHGEAVQAVKSLGLGAGDESFQGFRDQGARGGKTKDLQQGTAIELGHVDLSSSLPGTNRPARWFYLY